MPVYAPFEKKYQFAADPWSANDARGDYYNAWLQFIQEQESNNKLSLDLGCGEGAFTARLAQNMQQVIGVDIAPTAIARAQERFPDISFYVADLRELKNLDLAPATFDLICCSQVLYYFTWAEAHKLLEQIEQLLAPDGVVCFAAHCTGGEYFTPAEFCSLIADVLEVVKAQTYQNHLFIAAKRKIIQTVITVDYEISDQAEQPFDLVTFQTQVFIPCEQLMQICEEYKAKLTIFFEIGEYWFAEKFSPIIAERLRYQLQDAVRRGHDVQVHLHTRWLPQLGAYFNEATNRAHLAMDQARLHNLPSDELQNLLIDAKQFLERLLQPINPTYRAVAFRAGKYQIQPHEQIFQVLATAGYLADSSVWHGGFLSIYDRQPGYDYRRLWHPFKPYFPNKSDVCKPTNDAKEASPLLELPILAFERDNWNPEIQSITNMRQLWQKMISGGGPRIMICHTKAVTSDMLENLRAILKEVQQYPLNCFSSLQATAEYWHPRCLEDTYQAAQADYVRRSLSSPEELESNLSDYLRRKVDLFEQAIRKLALKKSHVRVLDVGCGTGELITIPLRHRLRSEIEVDILGIDIDPASIARATETAAVYAIPALSFQLRKIEDVNEKYDCLICCEVIEHLDNPLEFLTELRRILADDGLLLLSTPNGYGYSEIERRILYQVFTLAQRLPSLARTGTRTLYRYLRQRMKMHMSATNLGLSESISKSQPTIYGTLNFENDFHIQFYTLGRLRKLLNLAGFLVEEVHGVEMFGGLIGSYTQRKLKLDTDSLLLKFSPRVASAWVLISQATLLSHKE
ncbi:MAG: methyltransferase domain-containing protein [Caldilineaceae bacterium]